ncbi:MAG: hypothetical protein ACKOQ3_09020 [Novosphingobium sp.]
MRYGTRIMAVCFLAVPLGGCIARTAVAVVTAPVKVVSKGVDLATTSQSEADEKHGRALRQREERLGQLERGYDKAAALCAQGDAAACQRRDALARDIAILMPQVPVEPR